MEKDSRSSAPYVYPLMDRPNITVLTGALATRILFQRRCATGVEFHYQGKTLRAEATREVILSLGAIHTPKLLMQSGIGDEAELKESGYSGAASLTGVGRNLHDHVAFGCVWENSDKALPSVPRSQTACFWKTPAALDAPNSYAYAAQGARCHPRKCSSIQPPAACWSMLVGMRPKSRGAIHLTGPIQPIR